MEIILLGGTSTPNGYMKTAGIFRIATELRHAGYTVQTLDRILSCPESFILSFLETVISDETLMLGVSTTMLQTSNADYSHNTDGYKYFGFEDDTFRHIVAHARELNPNIKIVIGGAQVDSAAVDNIKQFAGLIDYCVKGQGDAAITALANHLKYGDELEYRIIEGFRFVDDKAYPVDDFDSLEIEYAEGDAIEPGEVTTIEIARGCVFKCKFCTYDLIGKEWGDMIKTKRSLIDELERNYAEYGITTYICADDTLNDSLEKVQFLQDIFTSLSFKPSFSGYFRLDILAKFKEQARLLKESGVWSMNFGIETMDKKAGALMGKGLGAERIKDALSFLHEEFGDEVVLTGNFIIGLPGESIDSMYATLAYLLEPDCPLHGGNFRPLNLSRHIKGYNSALFREAERFGYEIDDETDYWKSPILDYTRATEITHLIFRALEARKNPHYKLIHTFKINRLLNIGYSRDEIMDMIRNKPTVDFSKKEVQRRTKLAHDRYFRNVVAKVRQTQGDREKARVSKVILPSSRMQTSFTPVIWHDKV